MDKKTIKIIIDKTEWSFWDVQRLFEYVSETLKACADKKDISMSMICNPVSQLIQSDIESAIMSVAGLAEKIVLLEEKINKCLDDVYDKTKKKVQELYNKASIIKEQLKKYDFDFPKISLPYNWEELFKFAERLASMDEKQKAALLEFSKTFVKLNP
jgi:hypothetical protein